MQSSQTMPDSTTAPAMTLAECRRLSTLSLRTLGRMCKSGELRAVQVGRRWLVSRADFMRKFGDVVIAE